MKRRIVQAIMVLSYLTPAAAFAQDTSFKALPSVWTLQQCIDYAKQNNIQVNTLRLNQKLSEQDLLLSKAARYPDLSGSSTQAITNSKNVDPVVGGFQSQANFASNYAVNSSITLYNGGYLKNDISQKKISLKVAELNTQAAENDITLQVTQAYLNILLAKENIIYLRDLVATSDSQVSQDSLKYEKGSIAKKDLVILEAQSANDRYNLVLAQNLERQNTLNLKQLLQLPSGFMMNIVQPDTVIVVAAVTALDEAQSIAFNQRPEIKSSQLNIEAAQFDLLKAKTGSKPSISANGALATGYSDNQSAAYITQLDNNFYQRAGITLSIPIFNKRVTKTNVERSKIIIDQAKLDLKNTQTVLSQEVEQAYINVLNAQAQYDAAVVQLNANREAYRIASEQLRLSAITSADYLIQKTLYVQALQSYIQAKYNAVISVKIYDFYKGEPVKL